MDYSKINGEELDELRKSFINLFDKSIFPYKSDKVEFFLKKEFGEERVLVSYRNRTGYLEADNGYWGHTENGKDYYLIIRVNPYFTNVHSAYHGRAEGKELTWDKNMLNIIAKKLIPVWSHAIEENYGIR